MTAESRSSNTSIARAPSSAKRSHRAQRLFDIPIEGRIRPLLALRAFVAMARDPEDTAMAALAVQALSGNSSERLFRRFAADPMGARILEERRRLEDTLSDRTYLGGLPEGSLGRCYVEWTTKEGISARGLMDAGECPMSRVEKSDRDRRLFYYRQTVVHDLWHVVTGYGRDHLGEIALVQFMRIHTKDTGLFLSTWVPFLYPGFGFSARRFMWDARRRARAAAWLPPQDWETLLQKPLDVVRSRLRLGRPPAYAPIYIRRSGQVNSAEVA